MPEAEKRIEISHKSQLIEYFEQGCKPAHKWGIGTENEKFLFRKSDGKRISYNSESGICTIFKNMQHDGWQPLPERGKTIGLIRKGASVTLEPGGQFELSGNNLKTLHETYFETIRHFEELEAICQKLQLFSLPLGYDPVSTLDDISWIPKERYVWMKEYMPVKGELGLEMMANTASVQVNLDFGSEQDMIKKMRVAQALQPIATAIFANSPFTRGKPNGFLSYRAHIWDNTDPDRCGFLPFLFEEGFGFERWVDYLLDIPMYFIQRGENYFPSNGMTFRKFIQNNRRFKPSMEDWEIQVSTVFPDVRLKQFIEMRGADAGCVSHVTAVSALWAGLLYDSNSLEEAYELISGWDIDTLQALRAEVPEKGLNAESGPLHAGKIAIQIVQMAFDGLNRRSQNLSIENESRYLAPVQKITETGITQAERLLELYPGNPQKNLNEIIYNRQRLHFQKLYGENHV